MENQRKQKILIADDSEMNRDILETILGDEYDIVGVDSGEKAVAELQKNASQYSALLLDKVMPGMDGFEVLEYMNRYHWIEEVPVIMISAETSPAFIAQAYDLGVTDYISRPFDVAVVQRRVENTLTLYAKQQRLKDLVADQVYKREKGSSLMIAILSHIVEFRNGESGLHTLHINKITDLLLTHLVNKNVGYQMSRDEINTIALASALHDIGKIAIPDNILNKPGKLTDEEYAIMKSHSMAGAEMLANLPLHQDEPLVKAAYEIARWHHERFDGRGYPDGLKGDEIPISAQIVSIADVYDALTSERCYKAAFTHEQAMKMITNGECGSFNPLILECLIEAGEEIQKMLRSHGDQGGTFNSQDLARMTDELLKSNELPVSERNSKQLDFEMACNRFLSEHSRDMVFAFIAEPPYLKLNPIAAQWLDAEEEILTPERSKVITQSLGIESYKKLTELAKNTTPDKPDIMAEFTISRDDATALCVFDCRTIWSSQEPPRYIGVIGVVRRKDK